MADSLSREEIFRIWAPRGAVWSPWMKPVLFACMTGEPPVRGLALKLVDISWAPPPGDQTALVVDLPRKNAVLAALELAKLGYRPVPLYNAIPRPTAADLDELGEGDDYPSPVVEVTPILEALWLGTEQLRQWDIKADAPPAFLLDSNRRMGDRPPLPGSFDNRSISFTTDFPSANFLRAHGISRAMVVQTSGNRPQPDLSQTLRRWQEEGISIRLKRLDEAGSDLPCVLEKPSWLGAIWYRMTAGMGLRRHALGGYGGIIGMSSVG